MSVTIKPDQLYTVAEVADWLRVTQRTVLLMIRDTTLPAFRVGRKPWRFRGTDLLEFAASGKEGSRPKQP